MNAFDLYKIHNQTINNYLVVYAVTIIAFIIGAFFLYWYAEYSDRKIFFKSLFFTLLITGVVLVGAGLNFRANNIKEITQMQVKYQQSYERFLAERLEAASHYKPHFYRLLIIWSIAIVVLVMFIILLLHKKMLVGIFTGLVICAITSLALDFAGFQSDARYYESLKKLTQKIIKSK